MGLGRQGCAAYQVTWQKRVFRAFLPIGSTTQRASCSLVL